jgi:hypothetical protein
VLAVTADTARRPRRRLERGWDSSGGGSEAVRGGFV